jgi:iron complex outermembrane receptor protein
VSATFDRAGNRIPGVIPTFVNVRLGYDQPGGAVAGLGGFVELTHRDRYAIDNGNLLSVAGYTLANLNLHYDPPRGEGVWSRLRLFASVQNLFDTTYVGSASVIANSLNAATGQQNPEAVLRTATGSIYAGVPRTVYAGVKARF